MRLPGFEQYPDDGSGGLATSEAGRHYSEVVEVVAKEAAELKAAMVKSKNQQAFGRRSLRRSPFQVMLGYGNNHADNPFAFQSWLSIRTPIIIHGGEDWLFELRHVNDPMGEAYAFYSEKDANRPDHAWHDFSKSPLYVFRNAVPSDKDFDSNFWLSSDKELWYTIEGSHISSGHAAGDQDLAARRQAYEDAQARAIAQVADEFPEYVEMGLRHEVELTEIPRKTGLPYRSLTEILEEGDPTEMRRMRTLASHTIEFCNYLGSEHGQQRHARIEQLVAQAGVGDISRSGSQAVEHCRELLEVGKTQLGY